MYKRQGYYAESLCPDCIAFSNGPLTKAFQQISSIFTLHYVPWGNAEVTKSGKFECQHGKMECTINTVEACVLYFYPSQSQFWPFLHCMDSHEESQDLDIAQQCADSCNMDWDSIDTCVTGDLGHKLELMYANETASLRPPHQYTPWVTINGEHISKAEGSGLIEVVCKAYTGPNKPEACDHL